MAAISGMTRVSVLQTDTGGSSGVDVSEYYLRSGDVLWPDLSCDVDPERLAAGGGWCTPLYWFSTVGSQLSSLVARPAAAG